MALLALGVLGLSSAGHAYYNDDPTPFETESTSEIVNTSVTYPEVFEHADDFEEDETELAHRM